MDKYIKLRFSRTILNIQPARIEIVFRKLEVDCKKPINQGTY